MLNRVEMNDLSSKNYTQVRFGSLTKNNASNAILHKGGGGIAADKLAQAYRGYNNLNLASSVSFTGSLAGAFAELNRAMMTCNDEELGKEGEEVGKRVNASKLASKFKDDLPNCDDAIKTSIVISPEGSKYVTDARTQIKKGKGSNMIFEMAVRPPRDPQEASHRTHFTQQMIDFEIVPQTKTHKGTPETAYILNTKGKLMAVVEDGNNLILTNAGTVSKKDSADGALNLNARQYNLKAKDGTKLDEFELVKLNSIASVKSNQDIQGIRSTKNTFKPFEVAATVVTPKTGGSQGGGTEIVIGLEEGRFVPEIIDSIQTFCDKVDSGEIVLDEFVPAKNAGNIQISMLAGGFGSRAEYTNASSSRIMHGEKNGSNLTKGCFRTATGLTPMETTFISLHKAGLLDCSKDNLGIGKNVKFYLNDSGENRGNGGFSVNMYETMKREGRESLLILPNDAMSRIPAALKETTEIMNSGKAAVVMIAKEVDKEDARGSLGIMKIGDDGQIKEFAEKPKEFASGYVDEKGSCFANTFQFAVSKEAFKALSIVEPYLPPVDLGKESRDWSKVFTPVLMGIAQNDAPEDMQEQIKDAMENVKEFKGKGYGLIPLDVLKEAKAALGNQKIYAVKSNEPWADCGTLNALYHTTMQIASGQFPLEDFERKNVIDSINPKTGLVASTPEQKAEIESKYDIDGQVMVVPKAAPVPKTLTNYYAWAITRYTDK